MYGQNLFLEGPIPDVFDVFRVNVALSITWSDLENKGTLRGKIEDFLLVDVTLVSSNIQT